MPIQFVPIAKRKGLLQYFGLPHHEFWSMQQVAYPLLPVWLWYGIRLKNIAWVSTVNPAIKNGGFCGESKIEINKLIPTNILPKTVNVFLNDNKLQVLSQLAQQQIEFPLIAKPEYGGRGRKVAIINNEDELNNYLNDVGENCMLQEKVNYPLELGVFFYKLPNTEQVKITSLVVKDFLAVTGNGVDTIQILLQNNNRGKKYIQSLVKEYGANYLKNIVPNGQKLILESIGNHCRGTTFLDARSMITPALVETFSKICNKMPGINYGRFDLKANSWEDLYMGTKIKVMELNGMNADAAHIFDPNAKYREVFRAQLEQAKYAYKIAKYNLANGIKPVSFSIFRQQVFGFNK
jgi:hypothetical protein